MRIDDSFSQVKAMTFDVFGTVVDWRSSMIRMLSQYFSEKGIDLDPVRFTDQWRLGYQPAMESIRSNAAPWETLDRLHRRILDQLLESSKLQSVSHVDRERLVRMWHQIDPWPDACGGLRRLRSRFVLATLSNANISLLTNMARHGGLPWDCILSAEIAKTYKPCAAVYLTASELLDAKPSEIVMVAAHDDDLRASKDLGFRTAYIHRPEELFPGNPVELPPEGFFDISASDLHDLADQLSC